MLTYSLVNIKTASLLPLQRKAHSEKVFAYFVGEPVISHSASTIVRAVVASGAFEVSDSLPIYLRHLREYVQPSYA